MKENEEKQWRNNNNNNNMKKMQWHEKREKCNMKIVIM